MVSPILRLSFACALSLIFARQLGSESRRVRSTRYAAVVRHTRRDPDAYPHERCSEDTPAVVGAMHPGGYDAPGTGFVPLSPGEVLIYPIALAAAIDPGHIHQKAMSVGTAMREVMVSHHIARMTESNHPDGSAGYEWT